MKTHNTRIARNTIILYIRMMVLMLISLFTVRITFTALGVVDYGIINAVGGLVALSSLFTASMSAATSRFITYALGAGDERQLNRIFSTTVNIHLLLAFILVVILEVGGVWFLNTHMTIPPDRLHAANWMLHSSIAVFALGILRVPYKSCIIAHERMSAFAYMTIVEAMFKLMLAAALYYYPDDKLVLYAILIFIFGCVVQLCYYLYCRKYFPECHYSMVWDKRLSKEIVSFSGWNFMGAGSAVLRDHGVNILLNMFCGPAVNAARGIATQVNLVVSSFANNFTVAINPQITKSFASGERGQMLNLVFKGSRFSFFLLLLLSLPICLEAEALLTLWLSLVPSHAVTFVRLIIIYNLTETISYTMVTLMLATGNIRNYQLIVGGCQMLNFPISYLLLWMGCAPEITVVVSIIVALLCLTTRLYMLKGMVNFPVRDFLRKVLSKELLVVLYSLPLPLLSLSLLESSIWRLTITSLLSVVMVALSAYWIGCTQPERQYISEFIRRKLNYAHK